MTPRLVPIILIAATAAGAGWWFAQRARTPAALPPMATAAPIAGLVATVPEFKLADREGTLRSLADFSDRALIINFWATWCAPCRREIPLLQQIQREHGAEGFQVIGIAVDFREPVLAYATEMKIDYPLLIGEQDALDAAAAFGIEVAGFPFTVFTDRQHRIVVAHLGELHADQSEVILAAVRRVDQGELTPTAARAEIALAMAALPPPDGA